MARETILADTGPLVALVDEGDAWHHWALETAPVLPLPWLTCEAVITEAWHLLRHNPKSRMVLAEMHARGAIRIDFAFEEEAEAVFQLLAKYADVPMDFADACVVRMSELQSNARVWTIDPDFVVYRRHRSKVIPLILATAKRASS